MTLLSICQTVASQIPIAAPSSIVGNSDETALLLLALAQDAGEDVARRPDFGWVDQVREFDFTTASLPSQSASVSNVSGFAVISGLSTTAGMAPNTWYAFGTDLLNNSIVTGVTSSSVTLNQPATIYGSNGQILLTTTGQPLFGQNGLPILTIGGSQAIGSTTGNFVFGQSDYALPSDFKTPVDNTFWDRSRFWSMRGPMSPQQWQLYKSSVIGRASIQRRFRFRRSTTGGQVLSIDPVPTDNGAQLVFEYVSTGWCVSSGGVFQSSWQADTDSGVIDEYLIRLGLKWRVLRRKGMSYDAELDEYEREVGKAMSKDGGAAMLNLAPNDNLTLIGPWNLPETNYGGVIGS